MSAEDPPYHVEYAKSNRAACQACKSNIAKDVLRIAVVVQSPFHDGEIFEWYHFNCFFLEQRPESTANLANFDSIRWEDQRAIAEQLATPAGKKEQKRAGTSAGAAASGAFKDFVIEYAKSCSSCCGCEATIVEGEVRISKKDHDGEDSWTYGGTDRWHHLNCFAKFRTEFEFFDSGDKLPGFKALAEEDQRATKESLPEIKQEEIPAVKKLRSKPVDIDEENQRKKQNEDIFQIRDELSALSRDALVSLFEENQCDIPSGRANMLDALADLMTFGSLSSCDKCKGQFVYKSGLGYECTGYLTKWSRCEEVTQNPKRSKFEVPTDLKEKYPFLKEYKSKVKRRLIKVNAPTTSTAVKEEDQMVGGPEVQGKPKPLENMEFVILGKTEKDEKALTTEIAALGGEVVQKIHAHLAACISNPTEVEKMNDRMKEAKELDVQVVSEDFVREAKKLDKPAVALIKEKSICAWGGDPDLRITVIAENSESSGTRQKLRVKDGGVVDPDSKLEKEAHVYQSGRDKYTATLGMTDVQSKKNKYYKLQVLEADTRDGYWLFRSWGRIGPCGGGGYKLEKLPLEECIEGFERLYHDKSGNAWGSRDDFVKVPTKMYPIDVDYGVEGDVAKTLLASSLKSGLKQPMQDLIQLIFDVDTMQRVMLEFEIDVAKMPLGKLSRKQIDEAYSVLSELQVVIENGDADRARLVDGSNRFYTLVPHDFGVLNPPILQTEAQIRAKCEMLESLLELEIAYNLLNAETGGSKSPLDERYEQLNAEIDVLDNETEEFQVIKRYMENTDAATRSRSRLEIDQVFVVKRRGEDERYEPLKKLGNRKLLWHGSRTTNYAGILSQGLRIAPPEAPATGYYFGKGIYFADMVAKAAGYCRAKRQSPTGLFLLCEVALGNMYERHKPDYIEKLPKGKHSKIGLGQTCPDPNHSHVTMDRVQVPLGQGVPARLSKKSLLSYNEYIVYDAAQVRVRYLVKTNFKFN